MRVSYLEIYNEQCYDLLDISAQPSDIAIIEDSKDRVIVKGLAAPTVSNEAEALQHLFEVCHSVCVSVFDNHCLNAALDSVCKTSCFGSKHVLVFAKHQQAFDSEDTTLGFRGFTMQKAVSIACMALGHAVSGQA